MDEFHEIYVKYANDVFRYLICLTKDKELAEEFTQETFYRAVKNINKFNGNSTIYAWLCAIGKNVYYDHLRKHSKGKFIKEIQIEDIIVDYRSPEFIFNENEDKEALYREIEALDEPGKSILKMHLLGGISLKNISKIYGKSESFGRVNFYRAKVKLKERIMRNEKRM